jgi:hypothetical protein
MTDPELDIADVLDLSPVQVDDAGRLFISPVIHDWNVVTQRGIDTVVDLEGGLDIGVPTVPNQCLYVYFPIYDEELPNLNKLHGVASLCASLVAAEHRVLWVSIDLPWSRDSFCTNWACPALRSSPI